MRASTFFEGQRVLQKMKTGWTSIPRSVLKQFMMDMLRRNPIYTENDLKDSDANHHFRLRAGRGQRYQFVQSKMITSTLAPNNVLITILIDSDRDRSFYIDRFR